MKKKRLTLLPFSLADQYSGSLLDADLNGIWDLTSGDNTWQFTESTGVLGPTVIPEPNFAALLGSVGVLALLRRRRSHENLSSAQQSNEPTGFDPSR